jgi:death-on-curing protein
MPIIYLTLDQALEVHRKTVPSAAERSVGCLDSGQLDSILNHMRNDDYYHPLPAN